MNTKDQKTFDNNYQQLLKCLKLQGKADKTINSYSRALRRVVKGQRISYTLRKKAKLPDIQILFTKQHVMVFG